MLQNSSTARGVRIQHLVRRVQFTTSETPSAPETVWEYVTDKINTSHLQPIIHYLSI